MKLKFLISILLFGYLNVLRSETLTLLPIKSTLDTAIVSVFSKGLYSVLSQKFKIEIAPDDTTFHPDSNVFTSELTQLGDSVNLKFDIYLPRENNTISNQIKFSSTAQLFEIENDLITKLLKLFGSQYNLSRLFIEGPRGAEYYLNGELQGRLPSESFIAPGSYNLLVQGRFVTRYSTTLFIENAIDTSIRIDLWKTTRKVRYALWGLSTIFGLGTYYYNIEQRQKYDTYMKLRSPNKFDYKQPYDSYKSSVKKQNTCLVLGGVSILSALFLTFDIPF